MEWQRGEYTISTERTRIDVDFVHEFLTRSYWAKNISRELTLRSIDHSLPFGLFCGGRQVGFSRVITDYATFGYLGDVFVLEEFRGQGLSKWMMEVVFSHPDLQGFRRWVLLTRDAHGLYKQFGFVPLPSQEWYMERRDVQEYGQRDEGA